jgi:hypothetical protein
VPPPARSSILAAALFRGGRVSKGENRMRTPKPPWPAARSDACSYPMPNDGRRILSETPAPGTSAYQTETRVAGGFFGHVTGTERPAILRHARAPLACVTW